VRFVIIGGDAAGMSAASRARRNDPELEVVVLEQGRDVSYSACNIPYNIGDPTREIEDLVVRSAATFRKKLGIDLRTEHRVERIDRGTRTVIGRTGDGSEFSLAYDQLLIATGAEPVWPQFAGMDLDGVFVVKNLEHGRQIKHYLRSRQAERAVIIGMGYIALEMTEILAGLGLKVDLIKPRAGLLPWLDPNLAQPVRDLLVAKGVGLHDGHQIDRIVATGPYPTVISGTLELPADLVIAAIGVTPNAHLAEDAGLELSVAGRLRWIEPFAPRIPTSLRPGIAPTAFMWSPAGRPGFRSPCAPTAPAGPWPTMSAASGRNCRVWPEQRCSRCLRWRWPGAG
jgi:CoA-dependent NAD(P)H sulfur oxidoreductase